MKTGLKKKKTKKKSYVKVMEHDRNQDEEEIKG